MLISLIMAAAEGASHTAGPTVDAAIVLGFLRDLATIGSLLLGVFFVLAGTVGVLRLPDFFTRLHAAGMTDTLGAELIIIGLMIQAGFSQMTLKLFLVALFLFLTSPTATHAVASAAHQAGVKPLLGPFKLPPPGEIAEEGEH